jgi:uncharacterized membrane protein
MNAALDSTTVLFSVLVFFTLAMLQLYMVRLAPKKTRNIVAGFSVLIFVSSVTLAYYVLHGGFSSAGYNP